MTPKDVLAYFKTAYRFRAITGMSCTNIKKWMQKGYIPVETQNKIERITKGALKSDWMKRKG
jgi:hypothetical protein